MKKSRFWNNISEMIQDRATVTTERQWNSSAIYQMVPLSTTLSDSYSLDFKFVIFNVK